MIEHVDLGILKTLNADELRNYLQFLLWHYRVVDGFWFLSVEKKFDRPSAEHLDEVVWGKIAGMSSKDIVKRFHIKEKGLKGFARAMEFCPWTMIVGFKIEEKTTKSSYLSLPVSLRWPALNMVCRNFTAVTCISGSSNLSRTVLTKISGSNVFSHPLTIRRTVFVNGALHSAGNLKQYITKINNCKSIRNSCNE